MNGEGMSFKGSYGNSYWIQALGLNIFDGYTNLISGSSSNGGQVGAAPGEESKYTNVPVEKKDRIYKVFNSKFSFTVSKPINKDK
jgi:hypothetical protein